MLDRSSRYISKNNLCIVEIKFKLLQTLEKVLSSPLATTLEQPNSQKLGSLLALVLNLALEVKSK